MTLIDEIDESIRLGDAYGNNTNLAELLSEADVLLKRVQESEEKIVNFFQDAKNMKRAGLIQGEGTSDIIVLLSEVYDDASERNDFKANKFNILLKNINRERDDLNDIWNRYVNKEVSTQRDIVETLHILMEDSQRYITLSNLYNRIKSNIRPGNQSTLTDIRTYQMLADQMIKELNLKGDILNFFERLSERDVLSLKEMTPEIWDWIHQNHFEDKFTIKISANRH